MDRIKFRQPLLKKNGEFIEWFYWGDISKTQWVEASVQLNGKETRRDSQQDTGLKDKNKNCIYIGDIFTHQGMMYEVVMVKGGVRARYISKQKLYPARQVGFSSWAKQVEVIGNNYQNPELLR